MKKLISKNLKAGQTIFYPQWNRAAMMRGEPGFYEVKIMRVLSDKAAEIPAWIIADAQPRRYLRKCLDDGCCPEFQSFSRRKVASWIRTRGPLK